MLQFHQFPVSSFYTWLLFAFLNPCALEYCLHSVRNMMSLACKIAKEAPISPEMPTFVKGVDIEEVV